ncbi:hypothetical protein [Streptosporangium sp. NPDC049078]|uniref:hypothetical protein n=1 Tax=Streptosporangium sp. NPDC049078 TaxID=3155767 RepID=UPI003433CDB2
MAVLMVTQPAMAAADYCGWGWDADPQVAIQMAIEEAKADEASEGRHDCVFAEEPFAYPPGPYDNPRHYMGYAFLYCS